MQQISNRANDLNLAGVNNRPVGFQQPKLTPTAAAESLGKALLGNQNQVTQAPAPVAQAAPVAAPVVQPVAAVPGQAQPNPATVQPTAVSPAVQELLTLLRGKIDQAPVTNEQLMNDPAFKSQQAVIDFRRQQAQAQLNRSLASRNMLRSTPAVQALAGSNAEFTAREQALVPQMLAAANAQRQQELASIGNLLNQNLGVENQAFNQGLSSFNATAPFNMQTQAQLIQQQQNDRNFDRGVFESDRGFDEAARLNDRNFSVVESGLTGTFTPEAAQQLASRLIDMKQEATALALSGDVAGSDAISQDANAIRAQLANMGVDANELFGPQVTTEQARANVPLLAQPTFQTIQNAQARQDALDAQKRADRLTAEAKTEKERVAAAKAQKDAAEKQAKVDADAAKEQAKDEKDRIANEAKERKALVDSYTKEFKIGTPAAEAWTTVLDLAETPKEDGSMPTVADMDEVVASLANGAGITSADRQWFNAMWQSASRDDATAEGIINAARRKQTETETEPLQQLR
jgi:hypothetical protein